MPSALPHPSVPDYERRCAAFAFTALTLLICDLLLAGIFNLSPWITSQFLGILRQFAETQTLRATDVITGARAGIVGLVGVDFLLLALLMARALGRSGWLPGRTLWWWIATRAVLGFLLCGLIFLALQAAQSTTRLSSNEALYFFLCTLILATAASVLRGRASKIAEPPA